jgi:N-methylhydantoinase B/oxoprolinase/acetone carboxylase alpha subunit
VVLRRFCLRQGSGGEGQYKGGDGVIREVGVSFGQLCSKAGYIMPTGK